MPADRERWDERHRAALDVLPEPPRPEVVAILESRASAGRALDLASGTGRHALELARRGYRVEAWDVSPVGLHVLERKALHAGLEVATRELDLIAGDLPAVAEPFDLVVLVDFLHRPLHAELHRLLGPAGEIVVSTFTDDWPEERPPARYRLRRGELGQGLPGIETLVAAEVGGRAWLHGRRTEA